METEMFLAMTAAEFLRTTLLPSKIAWMACHFSPYGRGLSNVPQTLPPGSLLILNDRIPIQGHDPELIRTQLEEALTSLRCKGLLLDFQRPDYRDVAELVDHLCAALSCPVAVSPLYFKASSPAVFLPPLPHHVPLTEYIAPWQGREIWLELAADAETITLTENGASVSACSIPEVQKPVHVEKALHCHYHTVLAESAAEFTLWRTMEDVTELLEETRQLGIQKTVGLYQELWSIHSPT